MINIFDKENYCGNPDTSTVSDEELESLFEFTPEQEQEWNKAISHIMRIGIDKAEEEGILNIPSKVAAARRIYNETYGI